MEALPESYLILYPAINQINYGSASNFNFIKANLLKIKQGFSLNETIIFT
jgi:hypothetical protein